MGISKGEERDNRKKAIDEKSSNQWLFSFDLKHITYSSSKFQESLKTKAALHWDTL